MNNFAHGGVDGRAKDAPELDGADAEVCPASEDSLSERSVAEGVAGVPLTRSQRPGLALFLRESRDRRTRLRAELPVGVVAGAGRVPISRNGKQMCNYTRDSAVRGTVILAEDHQAIRMSLAAALRSLGYQVLATADGDEAVEVALNHGGSIDALIVDVVLPKRMGIAVARDVELMHPNVCTVFMSGYPREVALQSELIGDSCLFAEKPVRAAELDEMICMARYPQSCR